LSETKKEENIIWHPAFVSAVQLDLRQYGDALEYHEEKQLTIEPMKMDLLIIRKAPELVIAKSIGRIFRGHNIWEYKSPTDYVSWLDFYKLICYVALYTYISNGAVNPKDVTLTIAASSEPEKLKKHLSDDLGYQIEECPDGITLIHGALVPIQIIDCRELAEDALWLNKLSSDLDPSDVRRITQEAARLEDKSKVDVYLSVLMKANAAIMKEVIALSEVEMRRMWIDIALEYDLFPPELLKAYREGEEKQRKEAQEAQKLVLRNNYVNGAFTAEAFVDMLEQFGFSPTEAALILKDADEEKRKNEKP